MPAWPLSRTCSDLLTPPARCHSRTSSSFANQDVVRGDPIISCTPFVHLLSPPYVLLYTTPPSSLWPRPVPAHCPSSGPWLPVLARSPFPVQSSVARPALHSLLSLVWFVVASSLACAVSRRSLRWSSLGCLPTRPPAACPVIVDRPALSDVSSTALSHVLLDYPLSSAR